MSRSASAPHTVGQLWARRPQRTATAVVAMTFALLTACAPVTNDAPAAADRPAPSSAGTASGSPTVPAVDDTPGGEAALEDVALRLEPVVELDAPTVLAPRAGDGAALYIGERGGRVVRVVDGVVDDTPVLDIGDQITTDGERGLLGLDFSDDGRHLFVSSTDRNGDSRLDAYRMDGARADPTTRRSLLQVAQPYANHNGGNVVTGPDGMLYYGLGDGGAAGDPLGNGQDTSTLLGAMLRIDPDGDADVVPDDNPLVGDAGVRPEIWVYGLRNPWRFSFDRETDDLWIGDVGQGALEEIDRLAFDDAAGANLGWAVLEGTQRFGPGDAPDAVPPVFEYPHDGRCSVTGGYVYRGAQIPALTGAYVYGDFCDGVVRALTLDGDQVAEQRALDLQVSQLVSFGQDADGELYVLSLDGPVTRIVAAD